RHVLAAGADAEVTARAAVLAPQRHQGAVAHRAARRAARRHAALLRGRPVAAGHLPSLLSGACVRKYMLATSAPPLNLGWQETGAGPHSLTAPRLFAHMEGSLFPPP